MRIVHNADAMLLKLLPPVNLSYDITYIPSQFALPFEHNGKQYVFHNLTKQCIEGTLPSTAKSGDCYDEMIKALFLVPENKDESAYYNQVSTLLRAYSHTKGVRAYTILPTSGCNARLHDCGNSGAGDSLHY